MKLIEDKLQFLRQEVISLATHCDEIGEEKTKQLLLEIEELLEVTQGTFIGKVLTNTSMHDINKNRRH